jgi:hypothetical protein
MRVQPEEFGVSEKVITLQVRVQIPWLSYVQDWCDSVRLLAESLLTMSQLC